MKNTNPPPQRVYLSMHWRTEGRDRDEQYAHAEKVFDVLLKGGMKEAEAKKAIEKLWDDGGRHGYDEGYGSGYDQASPD